MARFKVTLQGVAEVELEGDDKNEVVDAALVEAQQGSLDVEWYVSFVEEL